MFDAVLGAYQYSIRIKPINYTKIHSFIMIFHLYIANIFLLNYLVAILGNVYGDMGEKGTFFYKIYKYKYIERYTIAFKDKNGYSELIIHAPPINIFLIALLPFLTNKEKILKYSLLFSKINFWFENIFLIIYHFFNELYLIPVAYFGVLTGLYQASDYRDVHLILGWLILGPFYMIYGLCFDMKQLFAVLKDYKIDNDKEAREQEE
jgi:hypothetical protein